MAGLRPEPEPFSTQALITVHKSDFRMNYTIQTGYRQATILNTSDTDIVIHFIESCTELINKRDSRSESKELNKELNILLCLLLLLLHVSAGTNP